MFLIPRTLPRQVTSPVVAVLSRLGITPNQLTLAQLGGGFAAAGLIGAGELFWGAIALLAAAALDAFDGTLARTTGQVTKFGGVLDSTVDRLFEGAVLGGVLYYYADLGAKEESLLAFTAMVGSFTVSYVRARAEVEGVEVYDGLFTRGVRILLLSAGLAADQLGIVLWILAVMTLVTTAQRLYIVWLRLRPSDDKGTEK